MKRHLFTLGGSARPWRFLRPDGSLGGSPTGGSVVIVWRPGVMAGPWAPPRVVLWEAGE